MDKNDILEIFRSTGALLEGHFILTSGKHSATYFQCAKVLQYPEYLTLFSRIIADYFENEIIDAVISPAIGGIVIGTDVGRQLGVKTIFTERKDGTMKLRRGFEIEKGERILIVEDVLTTGGSINEVIKIVKKNKGDIIGIGVVVDRSGGSIKLHKNQVAVLEHKTIGFSNDEIPEYLIEIPLQKPGSRNIY
ncbi:MAG: orotate phosphoribosyltransferase [Planctomycetia bacterium]|nr:orotate phosphoribosyltransferase [Planctomycetia bacterium]